MKLVANLENAISLRVLQIVKFIWPSCKQSKSLLREKCLQMKADKSKMEENAFPWSRAAR